jgi:hypothetical protein
MKLDFVANSEDPVQAEELVRQLQAHFPSLVADQAKGDAHVQERLDMFIAMGTPDVILTSHRSYFGKVIYVSISEPHWKGATVTSYVYPMYPGLGDGASFDVDDEMEAATTNLISNELATALGMTRCTDESE